MNVNDIDARNFLLQSHRHRKGGSPSFRVLDREISNIHSLPKNRAVGGHVQGAGPILICRVNTDVIAKFHLGARHFQAGLGWAAISQRDTCNDMQDLQV